MIYWLPVGSMAYCRLMRWNIIIIVELRRGRVVIITIWVRPVIRWVASRGLRVRSVQQTRWTRINRISWLRNLLKCSSVAHRTSYPPPAKTVYNPPVTCHPVNPPDKNPNPYPNNLTPPTTSWNLTYPLKRNNLSPTPKSAKWPNSANDT